MLLLFISHIPYGAAATPAKDIHSLAAESDVISLVGEGYFEAGAAVSACKPSNAQLGELVNKYQRQQ
jgi:hypothetical protein